MARIFGLFRAAFQDLDPLLRLTAFSLLEPEVELWPLSDSRAPLKSWRFDHRTGEPN